MSAIRFATIVLLLGVFGLGAGSALASSIATSKNSGKKQVTSPSPRFKKFGRRKSSSWKSRGQQAIDKQRVREIQAALIRENYLTGDPTGVWDASSKKAMQKYQKDRGWQGKVVPDSRALIQLGLGPKHENIINPETAMTPGSSLIPAAHAATAGSH